MLYTTSARTSGVNMGWNAGGVEKRVVHMQGIGSILQLLASKAQPGGGWGYRTGQEDHPEPTSLALLALSLDADRFGDVIAQGLRALHQHEAPDGGYRLRQGRPEATWPTAHVSFANSVLGIGAEEVARSCHYLLNLRGHVADDPGAGKVHDVDLRLVGWPWSEGAFSWVEPTAWACLALRRAGYGGHPRVREGLQLLLSRAFDEGGLNYGNRCVFGQLTEPMPGPTAIALLALQGFPPHPRVTAALDYLQGHAHRSDDLEHLCWAKLALDQYRESSKIESAASALTERITATYLRQAADLLLQPGPIGDALTALALAPSNLSPFRLTTTELPATGYGPEGPPTAQRTWHERTRSAYRSLLVEAAARRRAVPSSPARVHVGTASSYEDDLAGLLCRQYESFREGIPLAGKVVVLKPNLVEYHSAKPINTHPAVVAAAVELCRREGAAEVIVAEGPGHWRNVGYLVAASGLGEVIRRLRVPFADLNHGEPVQCLNLGRLTGLEYLYLARTIMSADVLISMPKLKTHHWAGVTLSLKNLFGIMPGICYGWPKNELHWRGIDNSIVDIALTRTPDLAIVDGILAMEGDGPINGKAKPLGVVVMGTDLVAVDATCCRLMRFDPDQVAHLRMARDNGLGFLAESGIKQLGARISDCALPFETLAHFQHLRSDSGGLQQANADSGAVVDAAGRVG
jgi:uncharacterized protein (DUF362 family)